MPQSRYFYETSTKEWDLFVAFKHYKQITPDCSKEVIYKLIKNDLEHLQSVKGPNAQKQCAKLLSEL
jgi:hypothetical protein